VPGRQHLLVGHRAGRRREQVAGYLEVLAPDALLDPDGLRKVVLKAGVAAGKARTSVTGKGANLSMSTLPLTLPVRVQLTRDLTPTCWDATFSTSSRNTAAVFTAKSDP
jgi:hypothetical protein